MKATHENLNLILSEKISEELANFLLETAKDAICNFCHINELPEKLETFAVNTAVKLYNRMGMEGVNSFSEGGKNLSYEELFTDCDKRILYTYRRLK